MFQGARKGKTKRGRTVRKKEGGGEEGEVKISSEIITHKNEKTKKCINRGKERYSNDWKY